ncbi:MAG TPA: hypothetical protein VGZ73_08665 [Bryobacteraceae bacterium]|jgi:hypothetical protein|nr:hypothetical protein [Bryobacteraceae bacterium]
MTKNLLILLALSFLPASAADVSGAWRLEGDIAGVHIDRVCTIKQADNKLSGGCKNQTNELALTGEVNGNAVTWNYDVDFEGTKLSLVFKGTLEAGTSMKGKIETPGTSGQFTAKKQ